ncbi:hypothetical protein Tco_0866579 [Tanacetum coccineum]
MDEGQSVSSHVLKMKSFIDKLEHLGHPWSHVLAVNKPGGFEYAARASRQARLQNQGMRSSKRLENGAMVVHMGNGNEAEVEATETYFLNVPSGIELCL